MQLITFEAMLKGRLEASGQVEAVRSFQDASAPFWYGLFVQVEGATVPIRLTRGSGTGDPRMTGEEHEAHAANIARGSGGSMPRLKTAPADVSRVEALIRDVLVADLPQAAVSVEGATDGRDRPGVKIRFNTGAEIYLTPMS